MAPSAEAAAIRKDMWEKRPSSDEKVHTASLLTVEEMTYSIRFEDGDVRGVTAYMKEVVQVTELGGFQIDDLETSAIDAVMTNFYLKVAVFEEKGHTREKTWETTPDLI